MLGLDGALEAHAEDRNNRVLIVDDQQEIHDDFREMLKAPGRSSDTLAEAFLPRRRSPPPRRDFMPELALSHAAGGEAGCALVSEGRERGRPFAVAYVDIRMPPGIDGVETIRRIRQIDRAVEIVIMTAYTDRSLSEIVRDMDLLHKLLYVRKPFAREEIQQITLSLIVKWNVERELAAERRRLEAVLEATGDAVALYDGASRLVFANRRYGRVLGLSAEDLLDLPLDAAAARFKASSGAPGTPAGDDGSGAGGSVVEPAAADASGGRSGERRPRSRFHRSMHPVRDARDAVIGDLVVYRDVSREIEIERLKREVRRLRSEVEGA